MVFHSNNPISVYEVSSLKQHLTGILPNFEHATRLFFLRQTNVGRDGNKIFSI